VGLSSDRAFDLSPGSPTRPRVGLPWGPSLVGFGAGSAHASPFCTVLAESLAAPRAELTFTTTFLTSMYPH
jgi:hypothetical protein